ncbi:centrosomal protein of 83 kDa-like, partial [Limanda limanda]|uniref:centrosomal protein of 83 kDa-like n=1 Tax=Limanda limanda TaxID=27771 RepID=UPI0029C8F5AE
LRLYIEQMESELHLSQEQNSQLTVQLHKAKREVNFLSCEIDSLKNTHKIEITNIKMQYICSKEEVERERDTLQADMKVLKAAEEKLKKTLVKKERETFRREQAASGEESCKTVALQSEKLELENRLAALEQQMALQDTAAHAQKKEWEEHLRGAQQGEESACREVQKLRTRLQKQSSQFEELRKTLDRVREELRTTRGETDNAEKEKHNLWQKYSHIQEKLQREAEAQKKRKMLTENKEKRLQDKIQLLQTQIGELELEDAFSQETSFLEAQNGKRLMELQRQHNMFQQILLDGRAPFNGMIGAAFLHYLELVQPAVRGMYKRSTPESLVFFVLSDLSLCSAP